MDIIEHSAPAPLINLIDEIIYEKNFDWGIMRVKKNHLKPVTNEAFLLAIRSAVKEAKAAHIFFLSNKRIYIAWCGDRKAIYKQLRSIIGANLVQPGLIVEPGVMTAYIDPHSKGEKLKTALRAEGDLAERLFDEAETLSAFDIVEIDDEDEMETSGAKVELAASPAQSEVFHEMCAQKPYRKQLQILVVEDQIFSQKLLCEILRGARSRNNNETPLIDTVQSIREAWRLYLKKAPDVAFVDLGLTDGSGHTLARAMKELDPTSCVVIVTANNYEEELGVARQNNVDGFIAKPYNKKQILDCVERYVGGLRAQLRGHLRGAAAQSR